MSRYRVDYFSEMHDDYEKCWCYADSADEAANKVMYEYRDCSRIVEVRKID